jgi:hypothetical protein
VPWSSARVPHAILELIRILDREHGADAAEAWDEEIERRAADVEAGTASTMTYDGREAIEQAFRRAAGHHRVGDLVSIALVGVARAPDATGELDAAGLLHGMRCLVRCGMQVGLFAKPDGNGSR